jgi:hypothetical protein
MIDGGAVSFLAAPASSVSGDCHSFVSSPLLGEYELSSSIQQLHISRIRVNTRG